MGLIGAIVGFLGPWTWWVVGLFLAGLEILLPGSILIWFAVAAVIVGALAFGIDMGWQTEVILFAVLSIVALVVGRRVYGGRERTEADPLMNDRLARMVGRIAVLDTAISGGSGHMRIDDTVWRVEGPDLPAGTRVRVAGHASGRLVVEAA